MLVYGFSLGFGDFGGLFWGGFVEGSLVYVLNAVSDGVICLEEGKY